MGRLARPIDLDGQHTLEVRSTAVLDQAVGEHPGTVEDPQRRTVVHAEHAQALGHRRGQAFAVGHVSGNVARPSTGALHRRQRRSDLTAGAYLVDQALHARGIRRSPISVMPAIAARFSSASVSCPAAHASSASAHGAIDR